MSEELVSPLDHRQSWRMPEKPHASSFVEKIPEGDNRKRLVCADCGYIEYSNPKIVVGTVCTWEGRVLLCRRAIAPAIGRWTIPAGFMELGESLAEGAAREVWEEAQAHVRIDDLVGVYEIPHISQVNIIYSASMASDDCSPGPESQEARLFAWEAIPWDELAFPSVRWSLERFRERARPTVGTAPPLRLGARKEHQEDA